MLIKDIESWVYQIIDQVKNGQPYEDSRVELKARWIAAKKAARQIAGQANAVRGEEILWIIGVDEKNGVIGAEHEELSSWWPIVKSCFDGPAPILSDLILREGDNTIVALYFETGRKPFVYRNPSFGKEAGQIAELEVPWREGTSTRTAKREELFKILAPAVTLPKFERLYAELRRIKLKDKDNDLWKLSAEVFAHINTTTFIVIPVHSCRTSIGTNDSLNSIKFDELIFTTRYQTLRTSGPIGSNVTLPMENASKTIAATPDEIVFYGPGLFFLKGRITAKRINIDSSEPMPISIIMFPSMMDRIVKLKLPFVHVESDENSDSWKLA